jgi:hypothetical protein
MGDIFFIQKITHMISTIKKLLKKSYLYTLLIKYRQNRETVAIRAHNILVRYPLMEKYLPKDGIGAELGVLKGDFSRILLDSTAARELHLIDPWYYLDAEWSWSGGNPSTVDAVINILTEFKKEIEIRKVFVHIQDDRVVLNQFPDKYFDWIYIDSSHAYEHTVEELVIIKSKIKDNGIICGDDWRPDPAHRHHGVYKAVVEFMADNQWELIYSNENNLQWFIQRKS